MKFYEVESVTFSTGYGRIVVCLWTIFCKINLNSKSEFWFLREKKMVLESCSFKHPVSYSNHGSSGEDCIDDNDDEDDELVMITMKMFNMMKLIVMMMILKMTIVMKMMITKMRMRIMVIMVIVMKILWWWVYRVAPKNRNSWSTVIFFSPCWIGHLFLIITPRSSNLVENFLFYE